MEKLGDSKAFEELRRNIEIVGADVATQRGFTQVPNFVLTNKDLTPGEKITYAMLLKYAWNKEACFPGQDTLAEDVGIALRSVNTHIKGLREHGLLEIKRRGLGKTNLYLLHVRVPKKRIICG